MENLEQNLTNLNRQIKIMASRFQSNINNMNMLKDIPKLIANIYAFWSLKKSGKSFYEAR